MTDEADAANALEFPDLGSYCRAIETHLCRVNGGHLVRVVGPAFDLVKRWHGEGVPLKIVMRGIERRAERAARTPTAGRRPLRMEFCEADVLDVLDEWRRAVGFALPHRELAGANDADADGSRGRVPSLPKHLDRVATKLTSFVSTNAPSPLRERAESMLSELDALRRRARALRGEHRRAALDRLSALDEALLDALEREAPEDVLAGARREAAADLSAYADRVPAEEHARLLDAATRRIARDRLGLPRLAVE